MLPMPDAGPARTPGTTAAFRLAASAVCPAAVMGVHAGLPLRPPENTLATCQRTVADRQLTRLRTPEMIERLTVPLTHGACIEQGVMGGEVALRCDIRRVSCTDCATSEAEQPTCSMIATTRQEQLQAETVPVRGRGAAQYAQLHRQTNAAG
jgi:hypothetical protein